MERKIKKGKQSDETIETPLEEVVIKKKDRSAIVLPVILILAIIGSIIGTLVTSKFILPVQSTQAQTNSVMNGSGKVSDEQVIVPLDEFVVNLAKEDQATGEYIRVTLSLLVSSEKDSTALQKNVALARDSVVNVLRQKKAADILDAEDGIKNLKKELQETINDDYGKAIVQEVYVTDFVIQ